MSIENLDASRVVTIPRRFGFSYIIDLAEGVPNLQGFDAPLRLFAEKREELGLPHWREIKFQDLRGWHSNFALTELNEELSDGLCRIVGGNFERFYKGVLKQGANLSDSGSDLIPSLLGYFQTLLHQPAVGYFSGRLGYGGREHVELEVVDLPALDRNGKARYILSFARSANV